MKKTRGGLAYTDCVGTEEGGGIVVGDWVEVGGEEAGGSFFLGTKVESLREFGRCVCVYLKKGSWERGCLCGDGAFGFGVGFGVVCLGGCCGGGTCRCGGWWG